MDESQHSFERILVDMIIFQEGFHGHRYSMNLYDTFSGFHMFNSGSTKLICNTALKEALAIINNLGHKVKVIQLDNETTFDNKTKQDVALKGIQTHLTATYTPEQNGAAERAGQTLTSKARTLAVESR